VVEYVQLKKFSGIFRWNLGQVLGQVENQLVPLRNHPIKTETFSALATYVFAYINQWGLKTENPMGHVGQVFLS